MKKNVRITAGGIEQRERVEPRWLQVDFLRKVAGLMGKHIRCETSLYAACSMDGRAVSEG